ncbi:glycosyltransferase [Desulfonatronovibrio magnus]|uniref:glycosyltransferase n=1 Tax=Desulfonatronovibrio magnus TaxID=698827 RepID=UPI0005EBBCCA|nr:glycosyltransferase [Desulfonatronovibrio magnus]
MNICMFTNAYLPHVGGVARSVAFFAQDIRKRGHKVLIVSPTFPGHEELTEEDNDVLRVPAIQNFKGSDFSVIIPLPFIISKKINEFQPQIIHSHHPYLLGDAALRAAYRRKLPLVFTHHTLYEKYTHYTPMDSDVMKRLAILLSTRYANLCSQVVAPSKSIARLIKQRGVDIPVEVIPTGVDIDFFQSGNGDKFRTLHDIPSHAPVIGHLGRLAPEKNLEYLARAVILALKQLPAKAFFLVIGAGPSDDTVRKIFSAEGLEDRLVMAGKQSGPGLSGAYKAMDVFVFSSTSETQGMVLVEAMAAGKPVIALDASGVREVVTDHHNGRLLPENTSFQEFSKAVIEFFNRPEHDRSWEKAALNTAREFSRDRCADRLIRLYESLLSRQPASRYSEEEMSDTWDKLLTSLKTEWTMLSERAKVIRHAVQGTENGKKGDDPTQ